MAKNRPFKILSRIVEIKPDEGLISLFFFSYFFLITAPYSIIKSVRNANYLHVLGPRWLPLAYFLTAVIIGFIVALHSKLQVKIPRHLLLIFSLVFFIFTGFLFWFLFLQDWKWVPLLFWIWANIFVVVLVTQFWIAVNDIFNPREAKRLIGFFGSGGILGGLLGGLAAGFFGKTEVSEYLLLFACGMLISCVFVVNSVFIWKRRRQPAKSSSERSDEGKILDPAKVGFKVCFETVKKNHYLKLLAAVVTTTLIVSTLIDFQFNSVIKEGVSGKESLTSFFGYFNAGLMVLPFLFQLLVTSNFIKRYGIRFSLLVFPLILMLCSVGVGIIPLYIVFAIIIKGSDKSLSYSLNQSVRELLYIPVSPDLKYKAKIFIDMFLTRFAKGIGALLLAVVVLSRLDIGLQIRYVSVASVLIMVGWIILNLRVSKEYTNTVKQKLEMKWERADRLVAEKVDMDYTKLVFDTLESKNRSSVLYAMHLLDLIKQDKLTPEVKKLISYKSNEMRISSLGVLFEEEATTWAPETDDSIDEELLKKEVKEIMTLDVYQEVMKSYMDKIILDKSKDAETAKMEVAKAIGMLESHSPLVQRLENLLDDESPEVVRYAIESAARLKRREHVPDLIQKLSNPLFRSDASAALAKYGSKVIGMLADYLGDYEENLELRKGAASVLAHIGTQEAADFISWELAASKAGTDTELIDALDKIHSEKYDIQFQKELIMAKVAREIKKYYQILIDFFDSESEGEKDKLGKELSENLAVSMMNIFRLLGLVYPREDIIKAYQNIRAGTKDSVAYATELLDNILKKEVKDVLFPIVEDISLEERVARCRSLLRNFPGF